MSYTKKRFFRSLQHNWTACHLLWKEETRYGTVDVIIHLFIPCTYIHLVQPSFIIFIFSKFLKENILLLLLLATAFIGGNRSWGLLVLESLSGHRVWRFEDDTADRLQRHGQLASRSRDRQDCASVCGRVHQRNSEPGVAGWV